MLASFTLVALAVALVIIFGLAHYHFVKACKRYKVTKRGENWVVRDSKGRFVTITDNYWNICKLGV